MTRPSLSVAMCVAAALATAAAAIVSRGSAFATAAAKLRGGFAGGPQIAGYHPASCAGSHHCRTAPSLGPARATTWWEFVGVAALGTATVALCVRGAGRGSVPALQGGRGLSRVRRCASAADDESTPGKRNLHIAIVDVAVTRGSDEAFVEASLENARASVKEDNNVRFDLLKSTEDKGNYALVEIYDDAKGPVGHKATPHYNKWRDTVADMMARPRQASQWDTIYPADADGYKHCAIILERALPNEFLISHTSITVTTGQEKLFMLLTKAYAEDTACESTCLRCDFLRNVESPSSFLLIKVYRNERGEKKHFTEKHWWKWRELVAPLMAKPRSEQRYVSIFPSLPAGWFSNMNLGNM
eukprot:CAMPEP_0117508142 /NCGR_PEP_ID=MMETSP0784-20121206/26794_1 /TAXON_ID=39447 /ORGANISM="" /LENGTH=357 /DNA_ID=CAMNT_0005303683 /DNA_START=35 /DNA_END=1108 /DNA_ORIENTATION=+